MYLPNVEIIDAKQAAKISSKTKKYSYVTKYFLKEIYYKAVDGENQYSKDLTFGSGFREQELNNAILDLKSLGYDAEIKEFHFPNAAKASERYTKVFIVRW